VASDSGPVLGLEQRCIRPGRWLIEGYTVVRHGTASRPLHWTVYDGPSMAARVDKLATAREWIADEREASRAV